MALRIDSSQNRNLYVGTGTEVAVDDGNAIITGNVGIGTTIPGVKLRIKGAGSSINSQTDVMAIIQNSTYDSGDNSGENKLAFGWSNHYAAAISAYKDGAVNKTGLKFYTEVGYNTSVEKMRIDSSGNVGIGLTPNVSYSKLQIKTPSSAYGFDIIGRDAGSNGESQITFWNSNQTTQLAAIGNISDNLLFTTGVTERMRIDDIGAVLIGGQPKIDTATKLQVGGNDSGVTSIWSNADDIVFEHNTNLGLTFATPNDAAATIAFADPQSVQAGWIQYLHDVDAMRFGTNGNNEKMRIDSSGRVGIGETSPLYKLQVRGPVDAQGFVNDEGGNKNRLLFPKGGSLNLNSTTGAIKVKLPVLWTNTMMRITLRVYDYAQNESFDVTVAGYNYTGSGSGGSWVNTSAWISSQSDIDRNFSVRFGNDGSNALFYIGELNSSWAYLKVNIVDVELNHSATVADWSTTAWSISMETTAFANVNQTRTNCQVNNWKRNGQNLYYGSGTGNVGIGTTSPNGKLTILEVQAANKGDFDFQQMVYNGGWSQNIDGLAAIQWSDGVGSSNTIGRIGVTYTGSQGEFQIKDLYYGDYAGSGKVFAVRGDGRAYFTGNVGIGTTSPTGALDVEAGDTGAALGDSTTAAIFRAGRQNVWFQNQRTAAGTNWNNNTFKIIAKIDTTSHQSINFVNDASFNEHIDIYTGNQVFNTRFNANGNVGIGTTTPTAPLHIEGGTNSEVLKIEADSNPFIRWVENGTDVGFLQFLGDNAYLSNMSNGSLFIRTNNTDKMTITSAGNVGIGTTAPSQSLHVVGNIKAFGHIFLQSNANGFRTVAMDTTDGADNQELYLCGGGTASSTRGGQVGVYGNEVSSTGGSVVIVAGNVSTGDIDFLTANTQRMIINNAGNVGIGTTSPNAPLQFSNAITTRKVVLYEMANNNNQFYGFGVEAARLVYSTANTGDDHVFYAGASSTSRNELIRIDGSNGDIKLSPSSRIILDDTPTASTASGSGTIVNWSVSDTTTAGTLYTVKTNGLWTPVDADNESTSIGMLAIALDSNAMNGMLLQGFFYKASHGFTIGLPLYISNTAGAFSTTRPTGTNDYVRIIGYATSANYIYFDPDKTWVKVA
jgi:hypothetical protein